MISSLKNINIVYEELYTLVTGSHPVPDFPNSDYIAIDYIKNGRLNNIGPSITNVKPYDNSPREGYKIIGAGSGIYYVMTPFGDILQINSSSLFNAINSATVVKGVIQGKCCIGYNNQILTILAEDSDVYRDAVKFTGDLKPIALNESNADSIPIGALCIDYNGTITINLGKYPSLDISGARNNGDYVIYQDRSFSYLYYPNAETVNVNSSLASYVVSYIPGIVAIGEEEAYMIAYYNAPNKIPLKGEPEVYIENVPVNLDHLLIKGVTTASARAVKSVVPVNSGIQGFRVIRSTQNTALKPNTTANQVVIRNAGLKRAI